MFIALLKELLCSFALRRFNIVLVLIMITQLGLSLVDKLLAFKGEKNPSRLDFAS